MEIGQKILDTIYKHNKSAYGASSECIEVVYDDDYDDLTDDLVRLFSLHIVSNRRELLIGLLTKLENGGGSKFIDKEQIVSDYLKDN